jgi:hypothetical protein
VSFALRILIPLTLLTAGCPTHQVLLKTPVRKDVDLAAVERAHFEELESHLLPEGLVVYMKRPPGTLRELYRQGTVQADGAYFQGYLLAMLSLKWAVTRDRTVVALARRAWDAHHRLVAGSGYPGLVARSFGKNHPAEPGYIFRSDGSGDALVGWIFGTCIFVHLVDDPARRAEAAADARAVVRHMVKHDFKIHMAEEQPTKYGNFKTPVAGIPVGHYGMAMMALANLAVKLNPGDRECMDFLKKLVRSDYHRQSRSFYSWFPHHADNTMMYAMSLVAAWWCDETPRRRKYYLEGAEEFWTRTHDWQMAFYALAYKFVGGNRLPASRRDAIDRLRNLPQDYHQFRSQKQNTVKRKRIVPLERRPQTSSYWAQNVWKELTRRQGPLDPIARCRLDFLLAYWFGRYLGEYGER